MIKIKEKVDDRAPPLVKVKVLRPAIKTTTRKFTPLGRMVSHMAKAKAKAVPLKQPATSLIASDLMSSINSQAASPMPVEVYCPPTAAYVPYVSNSPQSGSASSHSMSNSGYAYVEKSRAGDNRQLPHQPSSSAGVGGEPREAIVVRTTTTTRRTVVLSPLSTRPYTIV
ncbi:hypothetical protein KIN20_004998 [Parelaphostrongylus tenuis]|uniref:Uncharacterized protein n=1 Tax=Parelaphostrongylus tenuis TaxID=148309 RepID=A0AAD5M3W7_PARTN|nr:hypothetical protein KIN20_004998 [Parelaphostrongylus tenuis]